MHGLQRYKIDWTLCRNSWGVWRCLERTLSRPNNCRESPEGLPEIRYGQASQGNINWWTKFGSPLMQPQEFSCEAVIWRQLRHPNVLPFYGVYHPDDDRSRLCLSSPWMDNGTIIQFLDDNPDTNCICLVRPHQPSISYKTFNAGCRLWILLRVFIICMTINPKLFTEISKA